MGDDDLTPFADEPILRALTGPATPDELRAEAAVLAAFREATPKRSRRRFAARLGAGGSAFIAAAALSGGVAAASYTGSLPTPAQRVMNDVAGWAGVPAPAHHRPGATTSRRPPSHSAVPKPVGAAPSAVGTPSLPASVRPTASTAAARKAHASATRAPVAGPRRTTSPSPATSPSGGPVAVSTPPVSATSAPTITPLVPSALSASVSATRAAVNSTVTITGSLTADSGAPVSGQTVTAFERAAGPGNPFGALGSGITDADGRVSFGLPPLTHNVRLLLRTDHLHSSVVRVTEVPAMLVAVTPSDGSDQVDVSTNGATPGDAVVLLQRRAGQWAVAGTGELDPSGTVSFAVAPPAARAAHYRAVLKRTIGHARAATGFLVPPA